jgi:ABC-type polysaccharide/polyol phosphate transport system ATPase subunit
VNGGRQVPALVVDEVSKTFEIPRERVHTFKERALHPFRRSAIDELRALRNVSFAVDRGEFFGVVGRNGSGKSTLLKCMAGIYRVDRGRIFVDGRVSAFIELGVGFNADLPAKDNILINATMLGLTQREARARTDAILDFAELTEFTDLKIKNYSSGMLVRLAFSVMIQVDAAILLIDEVLAVGDASFQQKCNDEFARIRKEGTTVVLVTHDMGAVDRFCDRAILLEHGRLADEGPARDVAHKYLELNFSTEARAREALQAQAADGDAAAAAALSDLPLPVAPEITEPGRQGDGRAEIQHARFEDTAGNPLELLSANEPTVLILRVRFREEVQDPVFAMSLSNEDDHPILARSTERLPAGGLFRAGEEVDVRFEFPNYLAPGRYTVAATVSRAGTGLAWIDHREKFTSIVSTNTEPTGGLADLPCSVQVLRGALVSDAVA